MRKDKKTVLFLKDMYFPEQKEVQNVPVDSDDIENLTGYNSIVQKVYKKIGEGGEILEKPEDVQLFHKKTSDVPTLKDVVYEATNEFTFVLEKQSKSSILKVLLENFPGKHNASSLRSAKKEVLMKELEGFANDELIELFRKVGIEPVV